MEVSFLDLKEREVINVYDGKKLGRIIDVVFNNRNGAVRGIVVPGDKKIFRKAEDIFIPIEKIKRIGNDVILVGIQSEEFYRKDRYRQDVDRNIRSYENYYHGNYFENSYYPPVARTNKKSRVSSRIIYGARDTGKSQAVESKPAVSYVRLKPLERKKYQ